MFVADLGGLSGRIIERPFSRPAAGWRLRCGFGRRTTWPDDADSLTQAAMPRKIQIPCGAWRLRGAGLPMVAARQCFQKRALVAEVAPLYRCSSVVTGAAEAVAGRIVTGVARCTRCSR